jgi:uncharacterized membrane protein YfcA
MTPLLILGLTATMLVTSFLSGVFGMAGGLILLGVLLAVMPVPAAMALHAITQMASNGWRGWLWRRHVYWRAIGAYMGGCVIALALWSWILFVPSKPLALLSLGVTPFLVLLVPKRLQPNPESIVQGGVYGLLCMTLMLLTGVSGPLLDRYFLGGGLDRRQIISTKAVCQVFGHFLKLIYFGGIVAQAGAIDPTLAALAIAASIIGTTASRWLLEAMSDQQYRLWANRLIATIGGYYIIHGAYLLVLA